MTSRGINLALGAWLVGAAFLLAGPDDPARTADLAAGLALVAVSLVAAPATPAGFSAGLVLGAWVMLAPAVLAYPTEQAALLDVLTGMAIVAATLHPDLGARRAARA
jgi:hypothetical protein